MPPGAAVSSLSVAEPTAARRAARNIQKLSTLPVEQLNTYDVVKNAVVVMSKGSVEKLQEVYGA